MAARSSTTSVNSRTEARPFVRSAMVRLAATGSGVEATTTVAAGSTSSGDAATVTVVALPSRSTVETTGGGRGPTSATWAGVGFTATQ